MTYDEDWQNNRQKAKVTVVKKEKNTDRVLEGGVFALYTKNDILNAEGEVILKQEVTVKPKEGVTLEEQLKEAIRNIHGTITELELSDTELEPYSGDYNVVMRHICNIREKIEDDPGQPMYIQTVRGVGYRFNGNLGSE